MIFSTLSLSCQIPEAWHREEIQAQNISDEKNPQPWIQRGKTHSCSPSGCQSSGLSFTSAFLSQRDDVNELIVTLFTFKVIVLLKFTLSRFSPRLADSITVLCPICTASSWFSKHLSSSQWKSTTKWFFKLSHRPCDSAPLNSNVSN